MQPQNENLVRKIYEGQKTTNEISYEKWKKQVIKTYEARQLNLEYIPYNICPILSEKAPSQIFDRFLNTFLH